MQTGLEDSLGFLLPALSSSEAQALERAGNPTKRQQAWSCVKDDQEARKLKNLVRKCGPPQDRRPDLWLHLSGGAQLQNQSGPTHYSQLCSRISSLSELTLSSIEQDAAVCARTRPHRLLSAAKGQEALTRILAGATIALGSYPRGAHHVAALMLVVFGLSREEQAFWTFVSLYENHLFPHGQGPMLEAAVLEQLVVRKLPRVAGHLSARPGTGIAAGAGGATNELGAVASAWYSTLFATAMPPETVVRVLDCLMCEGPKILHRTALAILKKHEQVVLGCGQGDLLRKVLDLRVARQYDSNELLARAFNGLGSLPGALLDRLRSDVLAAQGLPSPASPAVARSSPSAHTAAPAGPAQHAQQLQQQPPQGGAAKRQVRRSATATQVMLLGLGLPARPGSPGLLLQQPLGSSVRTGGPSTLGVRPSSADAAIGNGSTESLAVAGTPGSAGAAAGETEALAPRAAVPPRASSSGRPRRVQVLLPSASAGELAGMSGSPSSSSQGRQQVGDGHVSSSGGAGRQQAGAAAGGSPQAPLGRSLSASDSGQVAPF